MEPTIGAQDARDKILAAMEAGYLATRRAPQAALEAFTAARARFEADAGLETPEGDEGELVDLEAERARHRARLRLYR